MDWILVLAFFMGGIAIGAAVTERFGLRPNLHTVAVPQGGDSWITVNLGPERPQVKINLLNTDEGLILDMYGYQDQPVATTWATDEDITEGI